MRNIASSATLAVNAIAKEKKLRGQRVYNFAAGDPILQNHPYITARAIQQAEKGYAFYPPVEGIPDLRRLAAEWVNSTCGTTYEPGNVLVTCGGKYALFSVLYMLLDRGGEVLIPAPYWGSYPSIVTMCGGVPKIVVTSAQQGWKLSAEELAKHLTKDSRALIINNACNPTGVLYSKQEIDELLALAHDADLMVISDEVYSGLVYGSSSFASCGCSEAHRDRVCVIQSCSKNFGMTGWRVGFAFVPGAMMRELAAMQGQTTTGVSLISQWAAVGALENATAVNGYIKQAMERRRNLFVENFNSLFSQQIGTIESALYAFVPLAAMGVTDTVDSVSFCEQLITSANIALVPGAAFGVDGHVRFAFSEPEEEIIEAFKVLKPAVERLAHVV
jgi:aspartate/methionine/tyrosine aminotransferase